MTYFDDYIFDGEFKNGKINGEGSFYYKND